MRKKHDITEEEKAFFREHARDVKVLKHTKIAPESKPCKHPIKKIEDAEPLLFYDQDYFPLVNSDDILQFSRPGIQHKILRNLRTGKYNVEAILDLHGMTVLDARQALSQFLLRCHQKRIRLALIIHGKGHQNKPILKNKVNQWLRQTEIVLAFCSATAREGRSGALYVLLKGA